MVTNADIVERVDALEQQTKVIQIEVAELRSVFTESIHELAQSNKEVADSHRKLSYEMKELAERISNALHNFQTAVPIGVVYKIFMLVFLLVGGIMALKSFLPVTN